MKTLICLCALVALVSSARAGLTVRNDGNYPDGTHYSYVFTQALDETEPGHSDRHLYRFVVQLLASDDETLITSFVDKVYSNPGPGSSSVFLSSGSFTIANGVTRHWWYSKRFWIDATTQTSWYNDSGSVSGTTGTGTYAGKFVFACRNAKNYPVTYQVVDAEGFPVGTSWTLNPGKSLIKSVNVPPSAVLDSGGAPGTRLVVKSTGMAWNATTGQFEAASGLDKSVNETFRGGLSDYLGSADLVPIAEDENIYTAIVVDKPIGLAGDTGNTEDSDGSVWVGDSTPGDPLSKSVFREGVDKITRYLASADEILHARWTWDAELKQQWDSNVKDDWGATANSTRTAKTSAVNALMGNTTVTTTLTPGTTSSPFDIIMYSKGVPTSTVHLAPWDNGSLHTGALVMKSIIGGFFVLFYGMWFLEEMQRLYLTVALTPQSRGNTLLGSGGQISAAVAAIAITAVLLAFPVAFGSLADSGIGGWNSLTNVFSGASAISSSTMQGALDLVGEWAPVNTVFGIISSYLATRTFGTGIAIGCMIAIRAVVPVLILVFILAASRASAAVTFDNQGAGNVNVFSIDGITLAGTVNAGTVGSFAPLSGSAYLVNGVVFEALDLARVELTAGGAVSVVHPARAWWPYFRLGFVMGCLWELGGLTLRLFWRVSGSAEGGVP